MQTGQAIASPAPRLTSGQVCDATSLSRGALRLCEGEGLIAPPPRSQSGYRLYPEATVDLVAEIELLKSFGFGLAEIREFLALLSDDGRKISDLRALAVRHVAEIDAHIDGLKAFARWASSLCERRGVRRRRRMRGHRSADAASPSRGQ
jgi:MerR family copper efflux transcriptional regulator